MLLKNITLALKKLGHDEAQGAIDPGDLEFSSDCDSANSSSDGNLNTSRRREAGKDERRFFCYEDTFSSKDINVEVEDIGHLSFPLDENCIHKLIKVSSKAKFGSGEKTVLNTSVRDTQKIPVEKLKVIINEKALSGVLERIVSGLNIDEDSTIEPCLHNLLIYGPGQFFEKHRDSEKIPNMIATLVIVLPSKHKGGDLIIEHNKKTHIFFGSQNFDVVKCVAFYSDCEHEVEKVREGYRVALIYNVILKSSKIVDRVAVDDCLDNAVAQYFAGPNHPKKLIFLLNHRYSNHSLKWNMLKGTDRTHGHALFAVAKKQSRIPYLALADYLETKESMVYGCGEDEVYYSSTKLQHWVDERNVHIVDCKTGSLLEDYLINDDEICYTIKTTDMCKPYKKEESGPTGNEGATCDYWYRRACVVLFSSKWVFLENFRSALYDMYQLTTQPGNEKYLLEEINKVRDDLLRVRFWKDLSVAKMLLKMVLYLKNSETAVLVLSHLAEQLLVDERIELIIELESQYSIETWKKILQSWGESKIYCSVSFINNYKNSSKNRFIIEFLLDGAIKHSISNNFGLRYDSIYSLRYNNQIRNNDTPMNESQKEELFKLLKICVDVEYERGEKKLIEHVKSNYPPFSQSEVFFWLNKNLNSQHFSKYKGLRDEILKLIKEQLLKLTDIDSWALPIRLSCSCQFCSQVNAFFKSTTATKVAVPAAKHNRAHVYSYLNGFRNQPIKFDTLRQGSPFKIVIEKLPDMKKNNKKLFEDLTTYQKKLKQATFVEPNLHVMYNLSSCLTNKHEEANVKVEQHETNEEKPNVSLKLHGNTEMQTNIKTETIENEQMYANIRVKSENNFEELVSIKTEPNADDEDDEDSSKLPPKRPKNM